MACHFNNRACVSFGLRSKIQKRCTREEAIQHLNEYQIKRMDIDKHCSHNNMIGYCYDQSWGDVVTFGKLWYGLDPPPSPSPSPIPIHIFAVRKLYTFIYFAVIDDPL